MPERAPGSISSGEAQNTALALTWSCGRTRDARQQFAGSNGWPLMSGELQSDHAWSSLGRHMMIYGRLAWIRLADACIGPGVGVRSISRRADRTNRTSAASPARVRCMTTGIRLAQISVTCGKRVSS